MLLFVSLLLLEIFLYPVRERVHILVFWSLFCLFLSREQVLFSDYENLQKYLVFFLYFAGIVLLVLLLALVFVEIPSVLFLCHEKETERVRICSILIVFQIDPYHQYYPILVTKAIYCCGYRWRFWSESCCSARVRFLDMRSPMIPREKSVTPIVTETPEIKSDCIISRPIFVNIYAWINRSTHTSPRRREGRLRIKNTFNGS